MTDIVKRLRAPWGGSPDNCKEAADRIEALEGEVARLRAALVRIRDCDWVITLPDRMDAVRGVARKALKEEAKE
jgi:hypothetical protein